MASRASASVGTFGMEGVLEAAACGLWDVLDEAAGGGVAGGGEGGGGKGAGGRAAEGFAAL